MYNNRFNKSPNNLFYKVANFLQISLLVLIAFLIWQIFYPGMFSPDSIAQYEQARGGYFNDWHPPLMSIVLWVIMKFGGEVSLLIFVQCLFSIFGLRRLVSLAILFFSNKSISKQISQIFATIVTIVFLIPFLTPFMFFSLIFWKDAWISIMLMWIVSHLLWMFLNFETFSRRTLITHILLVSLFSAMMILVRHNALIILPAIGVLFTALGKIKFGKIGLFAGCLPLLFALILNPMVNKVFNVTPIYLGNEVLASDLVTMLKLYPQLASEYPLTARHLNSPILFGIDVGLTWDESTEGRACPHIECDEMPVVCYGTATNTSNIDGRNCYMPIGNDNSKLKEEYLKAVTNHPVNLLYTKFYLFGWMIHPSGWWKAKIAYGIYENPYGIEFNERFTQTRETINKLSWGLGNEWYLIWISGIHILWMVINVILLTYSVIKLFTKKDLKSVSLFSLLLIPFSYYFSYTLASVAQDYRFMYPSTLIMQAVTFALLISLVCRKLQKTLSTK